MLAQSLVNLGFEFSSKRVWTWHLKPVYAEIRALGSKDVWVHNMGLSENWGIPYFGGPHSKDPTI